jgi:hypothetical protein
MICKKTILFVILILFFFKLSAQDNVFISGNFQQQKIDSVIGEIERTTKFQFYYNEQDFEGVLFTYRASHINITQFLNGLFKGSEIDYIIAGENVFLTKGKKINVSNYSSPTKGIKSAINSKLPPSDSDRENIQSANVMNKLYLVGQKTDRLVEGSAVLSGYVINNKTLNVINDAIIESQETSISTITDKSGHFSITLKTGRNTLTIKSPGMQEGRHQLMLYSDGKLNFELHEQLLTLREVNISAQQMRNVTGVELGVNRLDIKSIKQVPVVFGEADILRVVLTLPGVKSVGEANTGFNVRGGSTDQNLVLLNEVPVFSPAHFFGFFSAFNPDIVKDIELYKSTIPQKYGGRISSVLEVTNRIGNKDKFTGSAGIGLLTSRLNIEGPIDSGKTSFIFGGRTTYANWMLNLLPKSYKNSRASFYDFNLDVSHTIDSSNTFLISSYVSSDKFKLNSDTSYKYSNKNFAIKWKHLFSNKFYLNTIASFSGYNYNVKSESNPVNAYNLFFGINQTNAKMDFSYILNNRHTLDFGLNTSYYNLSPGRYTPIGATSLVNNILLENEKALESAFYFGDRFEISPRLSLNIGLRYSIYNYLGKKTVNTYAPGIPVELNNQTGSITYGAAKVIKTYQSPELRASFRYNIADDFSLKGGYNTLNQYIHLLSNSASMSPTDIWKLSDPNIKPQKGSQFSMGLYKNNKSNTIEFSAEGYFKRLKNFLDYKSGASLVLNDHIETDVVRTEGKAYGAEFMVKKTAGSLNGWISYTYSKTLLRMTDAKQGELINNGKYYPGNADKPHDFNFTGNYKFTHRYSLSVNIAYSTGRPITLPIAKYEYAGTIRVLYSDRNEYRIPDYFRTDISFNINGNHKLKQLTHNFWTIGVYNVTGRQNAYSTFFASEGGAINGYKLSIFASAIPFINYNIKF